MVFPSFCSSWTSDRITVDSNSKSKREILRKWKHWEKKLLQYIHKIKPYIYSYLCLDIVITISQSTISSWTPLFFSQKLYFRLLLVMKVKVLLTDSPAWSKRGQGQCICWRRNQLVQGGSEPVPIKAQSCLWLWQRLNF